LVSLIKTTQAETDTSFFRYRSRIKQGRHGRRKEGRHWHCAQWRLKQTNPVSLHTLFEFTFCSVQVAYTETERIIGDAVRFQVKKNFKNTILFPTRLLGLNSNCKDQIEKEQRFMTNKIVPLDNLKLGLEVT